MALLDGKSLKQIEESYFEIASNPSKLLYFGKCSIDCESYHLTRFYTNITVNITV